MQLYKKKKVKTYCCIRTVRLRQYFEEYTLSVMIVNTIVFIMIFTIINPMPEAKKTVHKYRQLVTMYICMHMSLSSSLLLCSHTVPWMTEGHVMLRPHLPILRYPLPDVPILRYPVVI